MSELSQRIQRILEQRKERAEALKQRLVCWTRLNGLWELSLRNLEEAERRNPEKLTGFRSRLSAIAEKARSISGEMERIRRRFQRDTLCIGVGGYMGQGKSTLLQAISNLDDIQIPTGAGTATTAVRSVLQNYRGENGYAEADMHNERTFLQEQVAPLCQAVGLPVPYNLQDFRSMKISLHDEGQQGQEKADICQRLEDMQKTLPTYEKELTGEVGRRIPLSELRPFVAYPENGVKGGKFLAVAKLVIHVPFLFTDVEQLRLMDLPGIGEAGLDLAKMHTRELKDECDISILLKKAVKNQRYEWTHQDTIALDAMGEAYPWLTDQTLATLILINSDDEQWAEECEKNIADRVKRPFTKMHCDARDKERVHQELMPKILEFTATNLEKIDRILMQEIDGVERETRRTIKRELGELSQGLQAQLPAQERSAYDQTRFIQEQLVEELTRIEHERRKSIQEEKEWDEEVSRVWQEVDAWVENGCGYGSWEEFQEAARREIIKQNAQPTALINESRVKFSEQWHQIDFHLEERIAILLEELMDALKRVLHGFIPPRMETKEPKERLKNVKRQVREFVEKMQGQGDLDCLRIPVSRIGDFELQFRFHLEPIMQAASRILVADKLPQVSKDSSCSPEEFCSKLKENLKKTAEEYVKELAIRSSSPEGIKTKLTRQIEQVVRNEKDRAILLNTLEKAQKNSPTFAPNRIFAAVAESFTDAFVRSKDAEKALYFLVSNYQEEISEAPDEATQSLSLAFKKVEELRKAF